MKLLIKSILHTLIHSRKVKLDFVLCLILSTVHTAVFADDVLDPIDQHIGDNAQPVVGEVGIVLGRAFVTRSDGAPIQLSRGDKLRVLDRISTLSNGHVHVHFLDDAYVSVRPNSILEISQYKYEESRPEESIVKFDLREGVARSISGKAARSARERYRLNTPIAAIGVRGTDFVVNANRSAVRAKVFEGSIILAPYSDSCSQESLGPCSSNAIELDTQTSQVLAIELGDQSPQLLSDDNSGIEDVTRSGPQLVSNESGGPTSSSVAPAADDSDVAKQNEVLLEGTTNAAVSSDVPAVAEITDPIADPIIEEPQVVDFTPGAALTSADLQSRQLVWGRYSFAGLPKETDLIALPFQEASNGRKSTVGNLEYGLQRTPATPALVDRSLGIVGFQLTTAQAIFNSNTGVALMQVNGGSLTIDFNENKFATELNLSHDLIGKIDILGSGGLYDGGFFRAVSETQTINGAVSYDGSEAGYMFEKQVENGAVSGLTLWDSK